MAILEAYGTVDCVFPMPVKGKSEEVIMTSIKDVFDNTQFGGHGAISVLGVFKDGDRCNSLEGVIEGIITQKGSWVINVRERYMLPHATLSGEGFQALVSEIQKETGCSNTIQIKIIKSGINPRYDTYVKTLEYISAHPTDS